MHQAWQVFAQLDVMTTELLTNNKIGHCQGKEAAMVSAPWFDATVTIIVLGKLRQGIRY